MEFEKIDVTQRVYRKVEGSDSMILYLRNEKIGRLLFTENKGKEYSLLNGFVYEKDRIYEYVPVTESKSQYVDGCDLG